MSQAYDLIIRNGQCVTPNGLEQVDLAIRGGRLADIGVPRSATAKETIDATGLVVLPGVIDSQVHFREPGLEHKEDLATGTRAAVAGGVTTIFEMPNTKPNTDTSERLAEKLQRAQGRAHANYAFFIGATAENADKLAELERLPGCSGIKVFMGSSTGSLLVADQPTLLRVLASGKRRVAIHAEDEPRLLERRELAQVGLPETHPVWRDAETALTATRRVLSAARQTGRAVHVLHVTTAEEMELLAEHKYVASCEVTPQHLTLASPDCYRELGTRAQMNPPIREERHRQALWAAINSGVVDVLGSDHAPHTLEEKARPYPESPSGMPGVQTLLPLMLNHVHEGRLSLARLVDLVCSGPARLYNIAGKGRIARGFDADLTLVDLKRERILTDGMMQSKVGWTPFDGMRVVGWPSMTLVGGHIAMRDDEVFAPRGNQVVFTDVGARER